MDIEGTYTLQAPVEEVCQCLADSEMLQHAAPGLERLEPVGPFAYAFALRVKQAPLRGMYQGKITVQNAPSPDSVTSYRFLIEGDGQHNPFAGTWNVRLSQQQENTVVAYSGALNAGKMSALLPPTLVRGAVKILIQQFFTNVAEQLRTTPEPLSLIPGYGASEAQEGYIEESDAWAGEYGRENGDQAIASFQEPLDRGAGIAAQTFTHRLVRLIGLGRHDPVLEEQWAARFKRYGAFSILLLLVWIGTRLPRRLLPRE
ncbi:MAG TPA: SRPBCC domain-containing protein [Ktedonobacteraceae bacterium]